jgi:hypothetical protein
MAESGLLAQSLRNHDLSPFQIIFWIPLAFDIRLTRVPLQSLRDAAPCAPMRVVRCLRGRCTFMARFLA